MATKKSLFACFLTCAVFCPLAAMTDKIDLPFVDDPAVLGRWKSVAYARSQALFSPAAIPADPDLFYKGLEFLPGGKIDNPEQTWTKGALISPADKTASRYTIKNMDGMDYMFLEWKSGDYILRDMPPGYYVLVREHDYAKTNAGRGEQGGSYAENTTDCLTNTAKPGICRRPVAAKFTPAQLKSLPGYVPDSDEMWQLDLRGMDISDLPLSGRTTDLMYADFDSLTEFPKELPEGFDPEAILESGKDPGLGIRALHRKGITGKGVSIAIIDQPLLVGHKEYASSLKSYEELFMRVKRSPASMHGAAVASIAVGKTCGVAPGANLYYIGADFWGSPGGIDFKYLAAAIDRVVAISEALPEGKKIRVISISRGFNRSDRGAGALMRSIANAMSKKIMVLTTSPELYYNFDFMGLGREPGADPDSRDSYGPGLFWQKRFFSSDKWGSETTLLVPMDSRTTASPTGDNDYVFYRQGGLSWSTPYIAGLYALACQLDPGLTPEAFFKKALETSASGTIKHDGREFQLKRVIDPARLLKSKL